MTAELETKNWSQFARVFLRSLASLSLATAIARAGDGPASSTLGPGGKVTGHWSTDTAALAPHAWEAQWIWSPSARGPNQMLLARTQFALPPGVHQARLFITADSRYQLYVNGEFVARGPARSAPHHQSFDVLEIAPLLHAGVNTLAVRVHHTGIARAYHQAARAGLLVQLETQAGQTRRVIRSDATWKVHLDPAWSADSPLLNRARSPQHDGYQDFVDCRRRLTDWMAPAFDDSSWKNAVPLLPERWWPAPQPDDEPRAVTPPWTTLVARDLPYLRETTIRATNVVHWGDAEAGRDDPAVRPLPPAVLKFPVQPLPSLDPRTAQNLDAYQQGTAPLIIAPSGTPGRSVRVVFDLGRVVNGLPRLDLAGPAGTVVDVLCAPYLLKGTFDAGMLNSVHADRLTLSGGRDEWEAFYFKPVRYLALVIRGGAGPVKIHFAGATGLAYPWNQQGSFRAPQAPWLEAFWQAGVETLRVVTTDAYTDNYRERRQYSQTSYYAAQGNYAVFGDRFLQRRYLTQIAQEQEPDGNLPSYAPLVGEDFMSILDGPLFWMLSLHDYLLYSGDEATTRVLLPNASKVMQRLETLANRDGLISQPPYPYWIDHSWLDRRGANFVLNGYYLLVLDHHAQLLQWLNEPGWQECRQRAENLRRVLRERFWEPSRQLFVDAVVNGQPSLRFSEHSQSIAIAADIATPEQAQALVSRLQRGDNGLVPVTPLFMHFKLGALFKAGRADDALAVMEDSFKPMMAQGHGTLWEEWHLDRTFRTGQWTPNSRADAQAENAYPPMLLARWLLGVQPTAPGWREVRITFRPTALPAMSTVVPTPLGELHVAWSTHDRGRELVATIPPGMIARLDLASIGVAAGRELMLDGVRIEPAGLDGSWYVIPVGVHRLLFQTR